MQTTMSLLQQRQHLLRPSQAAGQQRRWCRQRPGVVRASAEEPDAAKLEAMKAALQNPEVAARMKALEEQMKNPAMQNQMTQMMSVMQNPNFMARMQELREDPELKPMFEEMRSGGMAAMMKYMNDPEFLGLIGRKMGDVIPPAGDGPETVVAQAQQAVEAEDINDILLAVKYDDREAIEDFIAIGKGGITDAEGRSALHYAAAYDRQGATEILLDAKATLEARDIKQNTPLHYAAGYGRGAIARMLLQAGADVAAKNESGRTPAEIVRAEPRNPLNQDAELLALLDGASVPAN